MKLKGYILAALAAAMYGTNPAFAVPLYKLDMNPASVLLFRYLLGVPLLALIIICQSHRLLPRKREILPLAFLGIVMGISSLALYESYIYMNPGVASTLLFMYPVFTALFMTLFFHEKFHFLTGVSLLIMGIGLYFLMRSPEGFSINLKGFILIMISSLTYAVYLVVASVSKIARQIPVIRSLLYQLLFGALVFIVMFFAGDKFIYPTTLLSWTNLAALAALSTVLSLLCTLKAIKYIGPTPTAIFGALEPVTAVFLTIIILGETMTLRELFGGLLIILATILVIARGQLETWFNNWHFH